MNKQRRKEMLELGIERMTSALTIDLSKHRLHISFLFSEWYLSMESIGLMQKYPPIF